jgi:hypothetical protein
VGISSAKAISMEKYATRGRFCLIFNDDSDV